MASLQNGSIFDVLARVTGVSESVVLRFRVGVLSFPLQVTNIFVAQVYPQ